MSYAQGFRTLENSDLVHAQKLREPLPDGVMASTIRRRFRHMGIRNAQRCAGGLSKLSIA